MSRGLAGLLTGLRGALLRALAALGSALPGLFRRRPEERRSAGQAAATAPPPPAPPPGAPPGAAGERWSRSAGPARPGEPLLGRLGPPRDFWPDVTGTGTAAPPPDQAGLSWRGEDTPDAGAPRYANAALYDARAAWPWPGDRPIQPGDLLLLRVDIGPLSASSQVEEPEPFPDQHLPPGDLLIDVVVSSTSFTVGLTGPYQERVRPPAGHVQTGSFLLPGDGGPARAADGRPSLTFVLGAPASPGPARLRVGYYFRGAVIQSQLLSAVIGGQPGGPAQASAWSLVTDYTMAASVPGMAGIPARPRVAVMLNGGAASHEIYLRTPDLAGRQATATAVSLPPAIGDAVRQVRRALASEEIAPVSVAQSRARLISALRLLAPLGWNLYAALFPGLRDVLYALEAGNGPAVLHVARPAGVTLSVPWALLYTAGLDSAYGPGFQSVPLCPLVADWDGRSPLVSDGQTQCPHAGSVSHAANLLCPFGFLGFRHDIEQLNPADRAVLTISAPSGSRVVIAETAYQVDRQALRQHVAAVGQAFARLPGVAVAEAADKTRLKQLICGDLPLIYFFCHGERPQASSRETFLGIGNREQLTPADFIGWVQEAFFTSHLRVWDRIRPLIFINACHSAELDPAALFNYIDAFVGAGNAAGVIGTEVKVSQDLAMEFARCFFDELLSPGATVGTAIRRARRAFLARGNLFGLNYTPYCWADLTVTP